MVKRLPEAAGLLLSLCLAACGRSPAGPSSALRVPEDFPTIQAAVDAAGPGDAIRVAPGTYAERVVIDKPGLSLFGNRSVLDGLPLLASSRGRGIGTAITLVGGWPGPLLTDAHVSGFVVQNFDEGIILLRTSGCRIRYNEVRHTRNPAFGPGGRGLVVYGEANEVSDNFVHDNRALGIIVDGSFNRIRANEVLWNGYGIIVAGSGNEVVGNRCHGNEQEGVVVQGSGNSIRSNDAAGNCLRPFRFPCFDLLDQNPGNNTWTGNQGSSSF